MGIEISTAYKERLYNAFRTLYEGVKKVVTQLWQGFKRIALAAYVAHLQLEDERLASILYAVRKTVKRNKIMKRRIEIRDIVRRIQGGYEDGKERIHWSN